MQFTSRAILFSSILALLPGCIDPLPDPGVNPAGDADNNSVGTEDANGGNNGAPDAGTNNAGTNNATNACSGAPEHRFPVATTVTASAQDTRVPVPIQLRDDASIAAVLDPDDVVWFADATGQPVPFEVILKDADTGAVFAWVEWKLGPTPSQLFMHVGAPARRPAAPPAMWSDFAGMWHFDGRAGATIQDSSPNGNGATAGTAGASIGSGRVGSALSLDGSQHLRVNDAPSLRTNDFVIAAWVRPAAAPNNAMVATKVLLNGGDAKRSYGFEIRGDGTLAGYGFPTGTASTHSTFRNDTQMPLVVADEWQHVAYTRRVNDKVELFINGESVHSQNFIQELVFDEGPFLIGADQNVNGIRGFLEGRMDEVMLIRAYRNPEWVKLSYRAQSEPDFLALGPAEPVGECP